MRNLPIAPLLAATVLLAVACSEPAPGQDAGLLLDATSLPPSDAQTVPGADASLAPPDGSEPGGDASLAPPDGSEPGADASLAPPDASEPGADASEPGRDASSSSPDASAPGRDASAPGPDAGFQPHILYSVNANEVSDGELVDLPGVLVTGVNTTETLGHPIFVQVPFTDSGHAGAEHSGMYVYLGRTELVPAVGDLINVRGKVVNEAGWAWLNFGRAVVVLSSGNPLPTPVRASSSQLATGGSLQVPLQAVRVQVEDVRVTDLSPVPAAGDPTPTNEFVVSGGLRIDDFLFLLATPALGDHFAQARGILHTSYGESRLLPGSAADVLRYPRLDRFELASQTLQVGSLRDVRVFIDKVWSQDVDIALSYGSPALSGPASVKIKAGQVSATFSIEGVSAASAVTLGASYDSGTITASIQVLDVPQVAVASLTPGFQKWERNGTAAFTVVLEAAAPAGGQLVYLDSPGSNFDKVSVPATVLVPEGALLADVPVTTKSVLGTATISAYSVANTTIPSTEIQVVQSYPKGLLLAEVLFDPNLTDDQREWVVLFNGTGARVALGGYELRLGNGSNPNFNSPLYKYALPAVELGIGQCLVVGGPVSDADNGAPVYGHSQDFNPDLVNATSGASAGVALFTVAGTQLDTVIYGGDGSNPGNLKDETGSTAVDVVHGAMTTGASISRRLDNVWEATATPTPNACPPF